MGCACGAVRVRQLGHAAHAARLPGRRKPAGWLREARPMVGRPSVLCAHPVASRHARGQRFWIQALAIWLHLQQLQGRLCDHGMATAYQLWYDPEGGPAFRASPHAGDASGGALGGIQLLPRDQARLWSLPPLIASLRGGPYTLETQAREALDLLSAGARGDTPCVALVSGACPCWCPCSCEPCAVRPVHIPMSFSNLGSCTRTLLHNPKVRRVGHTRHAAARTAAAGGTPQQCAPAVAARSASRHRRARTWSQRRAPTRSMRAHRGPPHAAGMTARAGAAMARPRRRRPRVTDSTTRKRGWQRGRALQKRPLLPQPAWT